MAQHHSIYLEVGKKRTFAVAVDWPGWARQGPTEAEALTALLAYAPKYAAILKGTRLGFAPPKSIGQLVVVERLKGNATTDFGAPGIPPSADSDRSCDRASLKRFEKIFRAGWNAFDIAVQAARGKTLATGPRGGGRSIEQMVDHVIGADAVYLSAVGWKWEKPAGTAARLTASRAAILEAMNASAAGEIPLRGSRGGNRWTARYFVRRAAWHVIAHVWEIERRVAAAR